MRQFVLDVNRIAMNPVSYFERLGLPRRFDLPTAELEAAYLTRSRLLHPDNFGLSSGLEQSAGMELSSQLNEAYACLRDPFRRAEHLLSLLGGPSASEQKEMPTAFLTEMLEERLRVEEIRSTTSPEDVKRIALEEELQSRYDACLTEVGRLFAAATPETESVLKEIRERLNIAKYIAGLLRDLRAD